MRNCTVCGETKELAVFGFRNKTTGRRHRSCKICKAAYSRQHYTANRAVYIARNHKLARARTRELQERVAEYLSKRSCVDCGEADPRVMDFDHVDPATKRNTIHALVHQALSWAALQAEIERCRVRIVIGVERQLSLAGRSCTSATGRRACVRAHGVGRRSQPTASTTETRSEVHDNTYAVIASLRTVASITEAIAARTSSETGNYSEPDGSNGTDGYGSTCSITHV
jgi:hypothetical protein